MELVMPEQRKVDESAIAMRSARYLAINGLRPEEIRTVLRDEFDLDAVEAETVLDLVA